MTLITALNKQNLLDVCIQQYGTLNTLFEFADTNNVSITEPLILGANYKVTEQKQEDTQIVDYYSRNKIKPATATTAQVYSALGIGQMGIEFTFKIG